MKKKCSKCGEIKDSSEFWRDKNRKDGRKSYCRECAIEYRNGFECKLTCQNPDCGEDFVHYRKVKYCPKCNPKKKEVLLENKKRCCRCREVKDFGEFGNLTSSEDGKYPQCCSCTLELRKSRKYTLKCRNQDCCKEFISHDKRKKLCPDCDPVIQRKKLAKQNKKKCCKCKEVKSTENFNNNKRSVDGKESRCKMCKADANRNRKYELVCQNPECGEKFIANRKSNKYCSNCKTVTEKWSFEKCRLEASKYRTKSLFRAGSRNAYVAAYKRGWLPELIKDMEQPLRPRWSFEDCKEAALKYSNSKEFVNGNPSHYQKACNAGWLSEITKHMTPLLRFRTDEELQNEMRKYNSRGEFSSSNENFYAQSLKRDWYKDFAQELWGDKINPGGYSKHNFIEACERNNDGLGILYLIKCWDKNETFYKIGITSQTVEERYNHNGKSPGVNLPYYYEIIWTTKGDPSGIYDSEKEYIRNTSEIRYQPNTKFGGSATECFKCHGNCKILRRPELSKNSLPQD